MLFWALEPKWIKIWKNVQCIKFFLTQEHSKNIMCDVIATSQRKWYTRSKKKLFCYLKKYSMYGLETYHVLRPKRVYDKEQNLEWWRHRWRHYIKLKFFIKILISPESDMLHTWSLHHMKGHEVLNKSYTGCDPIWPLLPVETGSSSLFYKKSYLNNIILCINIIT